MKDHRRSSHSVSSIAAHIVWVAKYRCLVVSGNLKNNLKTW